jgi:hypothetical protein
MLSEFHRAGPFQLNTFLQGYLFEVFNGLLIQLTIRRECNFFLLDSCVNPYLFYFPEDCIFAKYINALFWVSIPSGKDFFMPSSPMRLRK